MTTSWPLHSIPTFPFRQFFSHSIVRSTVTLVDIDVERRLGTLSHISRTGSEWVSYSLPRPILDDPLTMSSPTVSFGTVPLVGPYVMSQSSSLPPWLLPSVFVSRFKSSSWDTKYMKLSKSIDRSWINSLFSTSHSGKSSELYQVHRRIWTNIPLFLVDVLLFISDRLVSNDISFSLSVVVHVNHFSVSVRLLTLLNYHLFRFSKSRWD